MVAGSVVAARRFAAPIPAALHIVARSAVPPPATMQGKPVGMTVVAVGSLARTALGLMRRLLAPRNEGWQAVNLAFVPGIRLGRTGLLGLWGLLECLGITRDIGLGLARAVRRFCGSAH